MARPSSRPRSGRRRRPSIRLWLPLREPRVRQGRRGGGARVHRAVVEGHRADGRQDHGAAARTGGRRADQPRRGRRNRRRAGGGDGAGHRLPADDQGGRRRRRHGHPRRQRDLGGGGGDDACAVAGAERVRQQPHLHGAPHSERVARRSTGHRGPLRQGVAPVRARLLGAAAQPEGGRGDAVREADAGGAERAAGISRPAREEHRLHECGDHRVPVRQQGGIASTSWR